MDIDDVFTQIGVYGTSQKKIVYILGSSHIYLCFHALILSFIGSEPDWSCAAGAFGTGETVTPRLKDCVAYEKGRCSPVYSDESSSIVSEWNLVCSKSSLTNVSQSVFFVGWLLGSWLWGTVADTLGRKKVFFINVTFVILSSLGFGLAPNYALFVFFRLTSAISCAGISISGNVLVVEVVGRSARSFAGFFGASFFSVGYSLLALLAYFIRSWRWLSVSVSLLGLCYYPLWSVIPESPRWLLVNGRDQDAIDVLTDIARGNGTQMPSNCELRSKKAEVSVQPETVSIFHLFRGRKIRQRMLIIFFVWFVICMVYYALAMMSAGIFGGNKYVSFSLSGLVEIPSLIVGYVIVDRIGRQWTLGGFLLVGGVSCIMWTFLTWIDTVSWCRITVALVGKFAAAGSFASVYLYTAELLPTQFRNLGMGVASIGGRLGGIISPIVLLLASYSEGLPMIIMGGVATGAGLLSLTLPETLNQPMPETLADLD